MNTSGPTTSSRQPRGPSPSPVAQIEAKSRGSDKVPSVVAGSASAPIAASANSAMASKLLFSTAVVNATGVDDGISGFAAAPGDVPLLLMRKERPA